jgi:uncharacterized protein DUF4232
MNDDSTTQYTPPTLQPAGKKGSKAGRVLGMLLLILILMAATAAGIYMWKQNELTAQKKDFDSKLAAAQAEKSTDKTPTADSRPAHELTPPKVATASTCNADELTLSLTNGDGGGAGTINQVAVLTNSGKRTCTLFGFPGVSLVNDNGNQVGSPADRAKNYTEKTVTLKPTEKAKAVISFSDPGNFEAGKCKTGATKLRVYAPNDTGYLSVASPMITAWCPGFATSPVQQ